MANDAQMPELLPCPCRGSDEMCPCQNRLPPAPDAAAQLVEAMKHLHDIINCGNCSGSRYSARLALRALEGGV